MTAMPIDLATADWLYVGVLAVFVFVATLIANVLSFGRHMLGAVLAAVLFTAAFVFWTYYPHHLPLPTALTPPKAARPPPPPRPAPATPPPPRTPVTDIPPPAAPASPPPSAAPANPPPAR